MYPNTDNRRISAGYVIATLLGAGLLAVALRGGSYDAIHRSEAFVLVWWILFLGSALVLIPRYRPTRAATVAVVALIALAAWTTLGFVWTQSAERTYAEVARVMGYAGLLLLTVSVIGARDAVVASAVVTGTALLVCALALLTRLAPDVITSTLSSTGYERRRLAYPFDYWNALGCWAAMTVGLALAWSAHASRWWLRGAALAGVPLAVSVAYLTYSRTTAVSVGLAAVAAIALSLHRWSSTAQVVVAAAGSAILVAALRAHPQLADGTGASGASSFALALAGVAATCLAAGYVLDKTSLDTWRAPQRATRAVVIAVIAAAVFAGGIFGPALADRAWDSFRSSGSVTGSDPVARLGNLGGPRYEIYDVDLDLFEAHPFRGNGAGTFEYSWLRERTGTLFVRDAHSLYLESLAELGVPGALLVIAALGALFLGALRASRPQGRPGAAAVASGGCAAFLVWCVTAGIDWMWESTAVTAGALVAAALAVSVGARPARPVRAAARAGTAVLMLIAVCAQLPLLVSASRVHESQQAFAGRDSRRAVEAATTAIQAQPWAATPLVQRALVLESVGDLAAARVDASAASRRETTNWRPWFILARIEAKRGRVAAALRAAARARRLNPRSPLWTASQQRRSSP